MAKVGLNFGEKMQIGDKQYRVLNDGLLDIKKMFGDIVFIEMVGPDVVYEEDRTQPRRQDGTYPTKTTGEIRGVVVGLKSSVQTDIFVTITDQPFSEIEKLGLDFREAVELENIVVTYSPVGGENRFKLFASCIKKAGTTQSQLTKQDKAKKEEHKN